MSNNTPNNNPQVYILIRTKLRFSKLFKDGKRLEYFKQCLESVFMQSYNHIKIIILQDSIFSPYRTPQKTTIPSLLSKIILPLRQKSNHEVLFYQANCGGATMAQYFIRNIVINQALGEDIVVQLDDDDYLKSKSSIQRIVNSFGNDTQLCIMGYEITGDKSMDITNQGLNNHNSTLKKLNDGGSETKFLPFLDSLGWTKSFKVKALREHQNKLKEAFSNNKREMFAFFKRNSAFEDFADVISLCRVKKGEIAFLPYPTHVYRKHPASITTKPNRKDFDVRRTEQLALVVKMAKGITGDNKKIIRKFLIIKILLIENILARYRRLMSNKSWTRKTSNGYFLERFTASLKRQGLLNDFISILGVENGKHKNDTDPLNAIREICTYEAKKGYVDICKCLMNKSTERNTSRLRFFRLAKGSLIAASLIAIIIFLITLIGGESDAWEISATLLIGFLTLTINVINILHTKHKKEDTLIQAYQGEVKELIRHLTANLNILRCIEKNHQNDPSTPPHRPGSLHFTNLKIPADSLLLANEPLKQILADDINNISRLKINIRNINNSAEYLEKICNDPNCSTKDIIKVVSWEAARCVGYIANFMFFEENGNFNIPSKEELKIYVNSRQIKQRIANELKPTTDSLKYIKEKYNKYIADRGEHRTLIYIPSPK